MISILVIAYSLVIVFLYFIIKELREVAFLKKQIEIIIGKRKIETVEDFIKIKHYLNKTINYNAEQKTEKRPLLRHTATQIIQSNYGFCGENARVAIKLFLLGGVKARRLYLFRREWQHVLVEHYFKGNWYMFDGHYDKQTFLNDEEVVKIPSESVSQFPNDYPNNPYLNFCRVKLLYRLPSLRFLSRIKLPPFIVYLFESPYLIKATITFVLIILIYLGCYLYYS